MRSVRRIARDTAQYVEPELETTSASTGVSIVAPSVAREYRVSPHSAGVQILDTNESRLIRVAIRTTLLIAADLCGMSVATLAGNMSSSWLTVSAEPVRPWSPILAYVSAVCVYGICGLYKGGPISVPQELRKQTTANGLLLATLGLPLLMTSPTPESLVGFAVGGLLMLVLSPVIRCAARAQFSRYSWWCDSAVIFGAGKTGRMVVDSLLSRPYLGVRPIAMIDDQPHQSREWQGVPVLHPAQLGSVLLGSFEGRYAIMAMAGPTRESLMSTFNGHSREFIRAIHVPDPFDLSGLWLSSRGLEGRVELSASRAFNSKAVLVKRTLDVIGALLLSLVALPIVIALALLIKLDSPGPVLFGHKRIGRGGRMFRAWKFRSMVSNADDVLQAYLRANPAAQHDWDTKRKLDNDPRVTRLGRLLRKTSLDELPQLWNILVGEMSLVGPRPIVEAERHHYREQIALYERVIPGLSGLWQVSGRSDTTYEERVRLDVSYIRNWSIWLDLYILARTLPAIVFGRGAR